MDSLPRKFVTTVRVVYNLFTNRREKLCRFIGTIAAISLIIELTHAPSLTIYYEKCAYKLGVVDK